MYKERKVFCFILARGGSKGLPRKNVRMIGGKPLVAHSIDVAKETKYIDSVFVSTDDDEIKQIAIEHGATVIDRPVELATDTSLYIDALKHLISQIPIPTGDNPLIVMLEGTFPIRQIQSVERCIELYDQNVDVVASVSEVRVHPSRMFRMSENKILQTYLDIPLISNRQQIESLYAVNGSIIVSSINFLKMQKNVVYGGRIRGFLLDDIQSMDIDTKFDFDICKFLMESKSDL